MTSFTTFGRAAACVAFSVATLAHAADNNKQPDPANPNAPVPPTPYVATVPTGQPAAPAATPDKNWKALNQTVGALNSMMLTMGAPEPAAPQPAHQHHQHHEGMKQ